MGKMTLGENHSKLAITSKKGLPKKSEFIE
jgi:hypothetical protein